MYEIITFFHNDEKCTSKLLMSQDIKVTNHQQRPRGETGWKK